MSSISGICTRPIKIHIKIPPEKIIPISLGNTYCLPYQHTWYHLTSFFTGGNFPPTLVVSIDNGRHYAGLLCRFDNQSRQYFLSFSSCRWSGFAAKYSSIEAHLRWCLAKGTRPMFDQYLAHPIQSYISLQCKHIEFSFSLSVIFSRSSQHEKHF